MNEQQERETFIRYFSESGEHKNDKTIISYMMARISAAVQEERDRVYSEIEQIIPMPVGDWNPKFILPEEVKKLQDAANEGWNNCRNLILEHVKGINQ